MPSPPVRPRRGTGQSSRLAPCSAIAYWYSRTLASDSVPTTSWLIKPHRDCARSASTNCRKSLR